MYFTLLFKNQNNEGPTLAYDLCFHPCCVWYNNDKEVLIPNSSVPGYEKGFLKDLISIDDRCKSYNKVIVVCHNQGHGEIGTLEELVTEIEEEGYKYQIINSED